ncbi:RNA polymerase recycling motor HelD [Paenibacillus sp. GCM10023252]|uniref:RNA polymerase recycling motor HelD n=1 Tax=Paenibacillus sp. GCM10023252 TaxID=3252649 RepID=UPI00361387F5
MSVEDQDWKQEQQRVEEVSRQIQDRIEVLAAQVGEVRTDVVDIRTNFWDDVTVNFEDSAEAAETYASMKQQAEVLQEREQRYRHAEKQLKTLRKLASSPYFGRVDFKEKGESVTERIYLGIGSFLSDDEEEYLIYDWRAPVSSLYYDYAPGPAEYETPSGTVGGDMPLKRQYVIRGTVLRSMFDTGVTIGDEILQEVLGKQSDSQMKSIVATIQKEQNQIIRNTESRLLVVQGAAGSGKTSAALQRVAYLLYRYRDTLRADQIVLFSPNPMFNSYVSTVLPELGEENMQQTTYQSYLEHRLGRTFEVENPFAQMEYTLTGMEDPAYDTRMTAIRLKTGLPFMQVIEQYAGSLGSSGLVFKPIVFRGEPLIEASAISEYFYRLDRSYSIPNRMKLLTEWLLRELTRLGKEERGKPWVLEEIELLDQDSYTLAYQELSEKNQFTESSFDDFDREQERLAATLVQERFKLLRRRVKKLRFLDVPAVYRQLFSKTEPECAFLAAELGVDLQRWRQIEELTILALDNGNLYYEDATPYLLLKELLEGFQTNSAVRHLFIDEGQDYSPFQFHFLKRLFPRSRMTVLGDLNQAIFTHASADDGLGQLSSLYGEEETERISLTRSYRSTREIITFTSKMLKGGHFIEPFNRSGDEPSINQVKDHEAMLAALTERIAELQSAGHASIAVICKTAEQSRTVFDRLSPTQGCTLIQSETVTFGGGVVVIPAYLAKGVEFDAVLIYDASSSNYWRESERKLFYTACTRAMHVLDLYYIEERTPFLS